MSCRVEGDRNGMQIIVQMIVAAVSQERGDAGQRDTLGPGSVVGRSSGPRAFFAGYGPKASTIGANRAGHTIVRQVAA